MMVPAESTIGEMLNETGTVQPSLRTRTVSKCWTCSPRPTRSRMPGSSS